jgi:hypothetical protein
LGKGSQTSTTSPNPLAASYYTSLLGQASNVAQTPYQAYTGELTAGINGQQTSGINNINANAGFATPYVQQAAGLASGAANPLTSAQINNYMSPYTQDVVNATQAQFNNQNSQQQAQLTGNNISQGALGGNRTGVASANLANQQQLAQAPVIAGLYNSGYQNALTTAQQQYQTNPLAAANSLANFGISGQNAALQGANSQLAAGTLQQQTQQAADTANYGQYAQAQAYPFQTTQWLAGLEGSIAPGLGSSTTGPAPNQLAQYLGLGLGAGALALSDRRAKQNIHKIGQTNDGQALYRYQYKGSSEWHIGPIAQEVERVHPEAVHAGLGGLKYVDLKEATDDSVSKRASGGPVAGLAMGGTPWSFANGWVPTFSGAGSTAPHSVSSPSTPQSQSANIAGLGNLKLNPNGLLSPGSGTPGTAIPGDIGPSSYGGPNGPMPLTGGLSLDLARGGAVAGFARGYADGGTPNDIDTADWPVGPVGAPTSTDPFGEANRVAGLGMLRDKMQVINPDAPYRMPDQEAVNQWREGTPAVPPSPPVVAADDSEDVPTAGVGTPAALSRPIIAPSQPYARDDANAGFATPAPNNSSGIGLGYLSKNAQLGLLAAGLGMLSSRSPFLGNAIGEGGLGGLSAYSAAEAADQKAQQDTIKQQQDKRRIDLEAQRLQLETQKAADEFAAKAAGQTETARHNKAVEQKEYKPTWGVIGEATDPQSGTQRKAYGWIDPNKKVITDAQGRPIDASTSSTPPSVQPAIGQDGKPVKGEEYLATIPSGRASTARLIGDYQESPADLPSRGGVRAAAVADAKKYNPDYNEQNYGASQAAYKNFVAGQEGRTVRSLNVATDHLDTLRQAANALQNGDIPLLNHIRNVWREQTGSELTTNFDSIKQAVSSEIAKVVVGGQTALQDRDEMSNRARNADSPAQLNGIFDGFTRLMGGQMKGLRQQYESGTYRQDFDRFLLPATKRAIAAVSTEVPNSYEATRENSQAPAGAVGKRQDTQGRWWYVDQGGHAVGAAQ